MHSLLKYANNKFEVDDISFSNDIVLEIAPSYACDSSIKELFYQVGNPNNCIYKTDGTVISLSDYEIKYNELILLASKFQFEQNEKLIKEQEVILNTPKTSFNFKDLFEFDISFKEQQQKIETLKQIAPHLDLTKDFYFITLDRIKKGLLKDSDWTQLPDVQGNLTEEQKEAWIIYRASLRSLDNIEDPLQARIPKIPK